MNLGAENNIYGSINTQQASELRSDFFSKYDAAKQAPASDALSIFNEFNVNQVSERTVSKEETPNAKDALEELKDMEAITGEKAKSVAGKYKIQHGENGITAMPNEENPEYWTRPDGKGGCEYFKVFEGKDGSTAFVRTHVDATGEITYELVKPNQEQNNVPQQPTNPNQPPQNNVPQPPQNQPPQNNVPQQPTNQNQPPQNNAQQQPAVDIHGLNFTSAEIAIGLDKDGDYVNLLRMGENLKANPNASASFDVNNKIDTIRNKKIAEFQGDKTYYDYEQKSWIDTKTGQKVQQ